jgi:hydroxymethylpyrimidine pyrophosphatase-like HAD family hydrolase
MQLAAFAFDYDGTLAHDGSVDDRTLQALRRLKAAGPRLLLVSGRQWPDFQHVFPPFDLFDAIVVENGALLIRPALHEERSLCPRPPPVLLQALERRHIEPLSVGHSIIATWRPNEVGVLEAIRECGLEWQIIFNKGAVMCLPPGVNKATGLQAALEALGLSPLNVLAVGDAENDHAMLRACGYRAAVANAIDTLKAEADIVTTADHGAGVVELIERFLSDPPNAITAGVRRHDVRLGEDRDGKAVVLRPGATVLIAGSSGGGKSRLATLLLERCIDHGYQVCVVDPEGEYERLAKLTPLGDAHNRPSLEEATNLLRLPYNNVALSLLGLELEARPRYLASVAAMVEGLRVQLARPHWLIIDEAHHSIPSSMQSALLAEPRRLPSTILITSNPHLLARSFLETVQVLITLGTESTQALEAYCRVLDIEPPQGAGVRLQQGEALYWERDGARFARVVRLDTPRQEHQRHIRKYAQGALGDDKSFHFRGRRGALNLRAQNLSIFLQLAAGVDEDTWLYHLQRGDYSRWFREAIDDHQLAEEAARIERELHADADASRRAISELVNRRYTAPADTLTSAGGR